MGFSSTVIPVAGLGTRFLPATKAIPKESLPVVDRPLIQCAVEEAVAAGSRRVVLVTAPGKEAVLRHFEPAPRLEEELVQRGKQELAARVRRIAELAEVRSALQERPLGVGHAILQARDQVDGEAFGVMFPDDYVLADVPALEQLRRVHERHGGIVFAVERVPREKVSRYGVVAGEPVEEGVVRVEGMVEKPAPQEAPSDLAIIGRYVLPTAIFERIEHTHPGAGGEIQLTDAMRALMQQTPCHAVLLQGTRYDCGSVLGFVQATIATAMRRPDLGDPLRAWLEGRLRGS